MDGVMSSKTTQERVEGWLLGRLPQQWRRHGPPAVTVDREEVVVVLQQPDVDGAEDLAEAALAESRAGLARAKREATREQRIEIAREAEHRFQRKVSWGLRVAGADDSGGYEELWTHVSAPVMTRLRQPERLVLDALVDAGVARSRSDAVGWCVRLVGHHQEDWLRDLREALVAVEDVRRRGPAA